MKKLQPRVIGVNILGTIGYLLALVAWVLLVSVVLALAMQSSVIVPFPPESVQEAATQSPFTGLSTTIAYTVAGVMALVSLVIIILLPYLIGKWSSVSLRWLLKLLRIVPTKRHLFLAKSIVVTLPLIGFFVVTFFVTPSMMFSALYVATVAAAGLALVFFMLQLIIARALKLPERLIW